MKYGIVDSYHIFPYSIYLYSIHSRLQRGILARNSNGTLYGLFLKTRNFLDVDTYNE